MDRSGVSSKRGRCQLSFVYLGKRYRPVLKGLLHDRASDRRQAAQLLASVLREIQLGTFYFPKHFPDHPDAKRFQKGHQITLSSALLDWLKEKSKEVEATTAHSYEKAIRHHLIPKFGAVRLSELQTSTIEAWLRSLKVSGKTKNNILIPLRAVLKQAFRDDVIERDPVSKIGNFSHRYRQPDPFNRQEMEAILRACEGQIQNIFEFAFWTGLRTSELIAVRWQDIDLVKDKVHVRVTRTYRGEKARGKTASSLRAVDLTRPAKEALLRQLKFTEGKSWVFENPSSGTPWRDDGPLRRQAWKPALERAGVRYRYPYQTRHTHASMTLSAGAHPMYVAQQMGHADWGMIRKVYGRWLPDFSGPEQDKIARLWEPQGSRYNAVP